MRALIQRVKRANVKVDGNIIGKINKGIVVFLGIKDEDGEKEIKYITDKLIGLRIFEDDNEKMNLALEDVGGEILIISQFTINTAAQPAKSRSIPLKYTSANFQAFVNPASMIRKSSGRR